MCQTFVQGLKADKPAAALPPVSCLLLSIHSVWMDQETRTKRTRASRLLPFLLLLVVVVCAVRGCRLWQGHSGSLEPAFPDLKLCMQEKQFHVKVTREKQRVRITSLDLWQPSCWGPMLLPSPCLSPFPLPWLSPCPLCHHSHTVTSKSEPQFLAI